MNLSNFSQIRHNGKDIALAKLNGDIVYRREADVPVEPIEKEYAIEYSITARNSSDILTAKYTTNSTNYYYYLPRLSNRNSYGISLYKEILITKNDGTTTTSTSTYAKDVKSIKIWWDPDTIKQISFYGYSSSYPCYIKEILNLNKMNTSNLTSMSNMFNNCKLLTSLDLSGWDTSNVESMLEMFYGCSSLTSLDVSSFNTSKVTNMRNMFYNCSLTSLDVSNFNTGKVRDMSGMFAYSDIISLDLSNFNTSNVTGTFYMFSYCRSLTSLDLSSFNTSNVTSMSNMFQYCTSLTSLDLSSFDTSKVTDMEDMFQFGRDSAITELIIPKWNMNKISANTIYCDPFGNSSTSSHDRKLIYIDLSESDDNTINRLINKLSNTKTQTSYGKMLVPETTSESVINSITAKYWKPIGPIIEPISFEIVSELDEIIGLGESTKLYYGNYEPWYSDGEIEFILPDNSVAYINENNELISTEYGSVEIYARLKSNNDIISNTIAVDISDADSHPYVIKFISGIVSPGTSDTINVNGTNIKLSNIPHSRVNNMYTYDAGAPITSIQFNGNRNSSCKNIEKIIKLNTSNITDMSYMFYNCSLTSLDLSSFDTSKVTDMSSMFYYCSSLTSLNVSNFDTSNVTDMSSMFYNCYSLTSLDLSSFDTSNVTDMQSMFSNCSSLTSLDLSNFNTSIVTDMSYMFFNTPLDIDFHYNGNNYQNFNLTEVKSGYAGIFPWNKPTDLTYSDSYYVEYTVADCSAPLNYGTHRKIGLPTASINGLQTYDVLRIEITLNDNSVTDNISTPCNMIKKVKVYYPESCNGIIFSSSRSYTINSIAYYNTLEYIGYINTSNFTTMEEMFYNCTSLTSLNLSNFNTSNVTNMNSMFNNCPSLTSLNVSNFDTSNVTNMSNMFYNCSSLTSLNLSNFNTSNVTDMSAMFYNCSSLTSLDVSNFNTSNVTNMNSMFYSCNPLTSLNLSNFNTSNVTDMSAMFYGCTSLTSLDLSSFDTSSVYYMSYMFNGCNASIYGGYKFAIKGSCSNMFEYFSGSIYDIGYGEVSDASYMFANSNIDDYTFSNTFYYNCNFSYCYNMSYMFYNCTNLSSFYFNDSSYHNTQYLNDTSYMFAGCTNLSELYINYMCTSNVWSYDGMFNGVYGSIYIGSDFTLTESDTGYNGTFIWY